MSPSLVAGTPLADLADALGWFAVTTPLESGGTVRSIVYVDGDVTTKLIGTRTLTPADSTAHFAAIDEQARRVRTRLRTIVVTLVIAWSVIAAALVAVLRDLASLAGAVGILTPLAIVVGQRLLRRTLTASAPLVAALAAAATIVLALAADWSELLVPAACTLVLNLTLLVAFAVVRSRLRRLLGAVQ